MPRLGIIGTMVWDRIYARDGRADPIEEWGGIAYALAAASAARTAEWTIVPILKLGRDLEERAYRFLQNLPGLDLSAVRTVPEPNNRVELRYQDQQRRTERLTGGVPPWTFPELEPTLADLDALYINFISGFELDLFTAMRIRLGFAGPIYADLHSLFLGMDASGIRTPRPLAAWREWLRCFDIVQVNEDELGSLARAWGDDWRFAADVVGPELRVLFITLGPRGAAYVASSWGTSHPLLWRKPRLIEQQGVVTPGAVTSERIAPEGGARAGDPTGCGDVWGATCFLRLLAGTSLSEAVRSANAGAARNVEHRGASGLHHHLQGRIAS
jgi:sugar/nucleoside kinase (ribokinase family)